jgi:ATP-binding cassette subfamily C (CFTR/MRP) protein 4
VGRGLSNIQIILLGRSPIFTHLAASMQGLSVIRASKAQEILQKEFDDHQNRHTSSYYLYQALYFAFAFWTKLTCCIYIVVLIYSLLYSENGRTTHN